MFNLFEIYSFGLMASGALPVFTYLTLPKSGKDQVSKLIIAWFATRVLADATSYIAYQNQLNIYPIFHVSVFIEFSLMMLYFVKFKQWLHKPMGWMLLSIPLLAFLGEIFFVDSIFSLNQISLTVNYLVIALLFLTLIMHPFKLDKKQLVIILIFFLYHAFLVVYGVFQTELRSNPDLFKFIYPYFWTANSAFNLFFAYYFWTFRKLEKGSVQKTT